MYHFFVIITWCSLGTVTTTQALCAAATPNHDTHPAQWQRTTDVRPENAKLRYGRSLQLHEKTHEKTKKEHQKENEPNNLKVHNKNTKAALNSQSKPTVRDAY